MVFIEDLGCPFLQFQEGVTMRGDTLWYPIRPLQVEVCSSSQVSLAIQRG